jgi:SecD/SecF fusion protein
MALAQLGRAAHRARRAGPAVALLWLSAAALMACGQGSPGSRSSGPGSGTTQVVYRLGAPLSGPGSGGAEAQLLRALRGRLADAGVVVTATTRSARRLVVLVAGAHASRSDRARFADLGEQGRVYFYDWEPNVIGPRGRPAPTVATVTGGPDAGNGQFGLSLYQAVIRGSKRQSITRASDTTAGVFYLVNDGSRKVIRGPAPRPGQLVAEGRPAGSRTVEVRPGTVIVGAQLPEDLARTKELTYYVLNDDPQLSGADLQDPQAGVDGAFGGTGQPDVSFGFTTRGVRAFDQLTRQVAQRGALLARAGIPASGAYQHYAIVLDDRLVEVPYVSYLQHPNGLDAALGSRMVGGFSTAVASELASILRYGPLPVSLVVESVRKLVPEPAQTPARRPRRGG